MHLEVHGARVKQESESRLLATLPSVHEAQPTYPPHADTRAWQGCTGHH